VDERLAILAPQLDADVSARAPHVDPLEVLGLMHGELGGRLGRFHLVLLDLRDESDFNRFHLLDAQRTTLQALRGAQGRALRGARHAMSVVVLMSNDEGLATLGWRTLRAQGVRDVYVLAGGVNLWLDVFRDGRLLAAPAKGTEADETLRHPFPSSLGSRHPFARPSKPRYLELLKTKARPFAFTVRPVSKAAPATGGCG
jgi:rhodanese-related sulfurtransferase